MTLPAAWIGMADAATVRVCAYCPDKAAADGLAAARGLKVTHGACDACMAKEMAAIEALPRAVPATVKAAQVARDVTGHSFDGPCGTDWVPLAEVARICAMTGEGLAPFITAAHWREARDYVMQPAGMVVRVVSLAELAAGLAVSGTAEGREAAKRLMRWFAGDAQPEPESSLANRDAQPAESWAQKWEKEHQ